MAIKPEDITVILPTQNESHNIGRFLGSVPDGVSLIVVDASDDSTPDIVTSVRPDYTMVIRHPGTVTEARRIGADAAATQWLLFTDADVVFPRDYFGKLGVLDGYDLIYGPKLSPDHFRRYYRWFAYGQSLIDRLGVPAASGSNCAVSKEAYLISGGFDTDLTCNEDSELAWRVKRCGFSTRFSMDLAVYATDHRRLKMGMIRKTLHSVTRCTALYFGLIPRKWRGNDWGYWPRNDSDRGLLNGN